MLLHIHDVFDSCGHLVDFSRWILSLRGALNDLRLLHLHCVDDVFGHSFDHSLGRCCLVFLRICVLTTGWFNVSLDPVMRLSALGMCVLNLLRDFRDFSALLRHLCFTPVDDLFNDSFWDPGTSRSIGM